MNDGLVRSNMRQRLERPAARFCISSSGFLTLDLDVTDDPMYGHQEGRFFHGYYDG